MATTTELTTLLEELTQRVTELEDQLSTGPGEAPTDGAPGPAIGNTLQYVEGDSVFAAIVTDVDDETVNLYVQPDGNQGRGAFFMAGVRQEGAAAAYDPYWRWPA